MNNKSFTVNNIESIARPWEWNTFFSIDSGYRFPLNDVIVIRIIYPGLSASGPACTQTLHASTFIISSFISPPTRCPDATTMCLIKQRHAELWFPALRALTLHGWFAKQVQKKVAEDHKEILNRALFAWVWHNLGVRNDVIFFLHSIIFLQHEENAEERKIKVVFKSPASPSRHSRSNGWAGRKKQGRSCA